MIKLALGKETFFNYIMFSEALHIYTDIYYAQLGVVIGKDDKRVAFWRR